MSQTTAICTFLGQENGLDLKTHEDRAHVAQAAADVADIMSEGYKARTGADGGAEFLSSGRLRKWLTHMEGINDSSSGPYLFGEQVTYADFLFFNTLRSPVCPSSPCVSFFDISHPHVSEKEMGIRNSTFFFLGTGS